MINTILLSLAWLVFFEGKPAAPNIQPEASDETLKCSLPAPQNVHSTVAGASFVIFEWDPVPGAAYYRVKVFSYPNNTLVFSRLVTALPVNNGAAINNLGAVTLFNIEVHSVCSNGVDSPRSN